MEVRVPSGWLCCVITQKEIALRGQILFLCVVKKPLLPDYPVSLELVPALLIAHQKSLPP